jgi:hypothetical protein
MTGLACASGSRWGFVPQATLFVYLEDSRIIFVWMGEGMQN